MVEAEVTCLRLRDGDKMKKWNYLKLTSLSKKLIEKKEVGIRERALGQEQVRKKQISINYSRSMNNSGLLRMFQTCISFLLYNQWDQQKNSTLRVAMPH